MSTREECRATATLRRLVRMMPCNTDDPITLEPLKAHASLIFRRVHPNGRVTGYIAPVLAAYLLSCKGPDLRDPHTNLPLHPVELMRLDRELMHAGCFMPSVYRHAMSKGQTNVNREAEMLSLELLVAEGVQAVVDRAYIGWWCGIEMEIPTHMIQELCWPYNALAALDVERARCHLMQLLHRALLQRGCPFVDKVCRSLICASRNCRDLSRFVTEHFVSPPLNTYPYWQQPHQ